MGSYYFESLLFCFIGSNLYLVLGSVIISSYPLTGMLMWVRMSSLREDTKFASLKDPCKCQEPVLVPPTSGLLSCGKWTSTSVVGCTVLRSSISGEIKEEAGWT